MLNSFLLGLRCVSDCSLTPYFYPFQSHHGYVTTCRTADHTAIQPTITTPLPPSLPNRRKKRGGGGKSQNNLINIQKYLLRSNMRDCLPFLSPCDVWGVTQRYSRGGESLCWNGWWQGFHPTHWGPFVVILGSLMGAIWESSRQTGLISRTHTYKEAQTARARAHPQKK